MVAKEPFLTFGLDLKLGEVEAVMCDLKQAAIDQVGMPTDQVEESPELPSSRSGELYRTFRSATCSGVKSSRVIVVPTLKGDWSRLPMKRCASVA